MQLPSSNRIQFILQKIKWQNISPAKTDAAANYSCNYSLSFYQVAGMCS